MEQANSDRPYFEVLVVEDMSDQQERALREEMRRWRRPDDPFTYEIVVVPSLDDAVMAARLNFRLQACVVRRRFTHRSRYDSSSLAQFVDASLAGDLMEHSPDERAQVLARTLARIRPELDLYLMTEISVEDLAGRLSHHFRRIFHTREGSLELHLSILDGIGPGTARHSSARCAATVTGRPGCSTRCRSRTASQSWSRTGSGT
jgi:arginine decarboxylase